MAGERVVHMRNRKAEELLAYLACERGRPVRKTTVCEDIWPGAEPEKARDCLYKACRHIRQFKAEGVDVPVMLRRGSIWLDMERVETDTEAFLSLYHENNPKADADAVDIYEGPLLSDECYEWSNVYEASFEIRYIELLQRLTTHYREAGLQRIENYYLEKSMMYI